MNGFLYSTILQWKIDFRNKNVLLVYYLVPLVFYFVMGSVFSSINPQSEHTIIQTMTIFAVSMGAFFGTSSNMMELINDDAKKAYKVGNIPLWSIPLTVFISAFVHLFVVAIVIFFLSSVLFGAIYPTNIISYFLYLFLFITVSIIIGILIGFIAKNSSVLMMVSQLIFLPSILISGIMFDLEFLPGFLILVSNIIPATHAMKILSETNVNNYISVLWLFALGVIGVIVIKIIYNRTCKRK